jgi:penicillin-binding protein 2
MAEPLALKDHSGESRIFFERAALGFALLILLALIIVGRMFYLQIIQHDIYATLSDKNRIQVEPLPPVRGLVYDRNGELIADNIPTLNLTVTRELAGDLEDTLAKIDALVGLTQDDRDAFQRRMKRRQRPYEPVPVLFKLSAEEQARIAVNEYAMPGVKVEARLVRHYPKGELMAHAVGSVRRINESDARKLDRVAYSGTNHIGKIGVEKFYESVLLGKVGHRRVETNARGRVMTELEVIDPVPGRDLTLHVDVALQQAASDALGDRRGSIVAIDPKTGGILAMVSKPSYDPNLFVTGIDHKTYASLRDSADTPLFNRALQGQYEPGSTVKPLIGLAGLVTGTVTADYTIKDPGWFRLPNDKRLYRDWNWKASGTGGHGEVHFQKAIYRSCNVYFYNLAVDLGIDRIHDYLALFGFGRNTALDLPEARRGLLPSADWKLETRGLPWFPGDTVNIGIGQGDFLVTPLQLATAISVLANRGRWIAPRMLLGPENYIKDSSGGMKDIELVPRHVWNEVTSGMEKVVHRGNQVYGENGTAWAYIGRGINYRMAGKSGTAQVVGIKQGEEYDEEELTERQRKHAWFVAFAPIEDPQIALAVLVENGGGGSQFASPVARQVIDYYLEHQYRVAGTVPAQ